MIVNKLSFIYLFIASVDKAYFSRILTDHFCNENPNPCANGGECFEIDEKITCICQPPWTGDSCENLIETEDNNYVSDICKFCVNGGYCQSKESLYCTCPQGYFGTTCDSKKSTGFHLWPIVPKLLCVIVIFSYISFFIIDRYNKLTSGEDPEVTESYIASETYNIRSPYLVHQYDECPPPYEHLPTYQEATTARA